MVLCPCALNLPTLEFESVVHIGSSDIRPVPSRVTNSQEGCLLSVSVHPDVWRRIARLGGGAWTKLSFPYPLRFVDLPESLETNRDEILAAGFAGDLITEATFWKSFHTDEEGEEGHFLHATKEEADAEDGVRDPERAQVFLSTETLSCFWCGSPKKISPFFTLSALVAFLVKDDPAIHGVWWNDFFDPCSLSAPRGGIFQDRIPLLTQEITDRGSKVRA
jgi:hypothetical protein